MHQFCINNNRFFQLLFFLFILSNLIIEICCAGVPIGMVIQPMPGFTLDSCEIVMPGKNDPHPLYIDVYYVFPATLGFNPKILVAIKGMEWEGNLYFEYQNLTQTATYLLIRITKYPTVNTTTQNIYLMRFNLLLCQDAHYYFIIQDFIYNISSTVATVAAQSFTVNYVGGQFAILSGYQDFTDSNFIPNSVPNIFSNGGGTIIFDNNNGLNGYMIITLIYKLVQVLQTVMYDMNTYYETQFFYSTCDLSSACGGTITFFESVFPNKFFDGVMGFTAMSSVSYNASFTFNLTAQTEFMSNVHIYVFQFTLFYHTCPLTSKYYSARDLFCWSLCPDTTYLVPQSTTAPLTFYKYYCGLCAVYCLNCKQSAGNCTSCVGENRYFLTNATQNTHVCLCPLGQYGIPPTCTYCNQTLFYCIKCDSIATCLECDAGLIFNPVSNMCECPPSLQQVLNNFTYVNSNNVSITVGKLRCISKKIVESCMDSVLTNLLPLDMNIFSYGQTCSCVTGGQYIQNKCI